MDVIILTTMFACMLQNFLINHAIPQDWMVSSMELEEDEVLEHHNETAK